MSRRLDLWKRSFDVHMYWDIDTCPLNTNNADREFPTIVQNIRQVLREFCEHYVLETITICGDIDRYGGEPAFRGTIHRSEVERKSGMNIRPLSSREVLNFPIRHPYHTDCKSGDYKKPPMSNHRIKDALYRLVDEHGPPRTLLLITSDPDMPDLVADLVDKGCTILIAHEEYACEDLKECGTRRILWPELKAGQGYFAANGDDDEASDGDDDGDDDEPIYGYDDGDDDEPIYGDDDELIYGDDDG